MSNSIDARRDGGRGLSHLPDARSARSAALVADHRAGLATPARWLEDSVLQRLVGRWTLQGSIRGRDATYEMRARWVLDHQFVRINLRHPRYRATIYLGRDHISSRYVLHWLDVGGGRLSQTLGYGHVVGGALEVVLEYPSGPSRVTLTLNSKGGPQSVLVTDYRGDQASEVAQFVVRTWKGVRGAARRKPHWEAPAARAG